MLETLFYADEVRKQPESDASGTKVTEKELEMASALIELLRKPFDASEYHDHYREALEEMIEAKQAGREIVTSPKRRRPRSSTSPTPCAEAWRPPKRAPSPRPPPAVLRAPRHGGVRARSAENAAVIHHRDTEHTEQEAPSLFSVSLW